METNMIEKPKPLPLDTKSILGLLFVAAVVIGLIWFGYTLFIYMPAHNMDRCAEGFKYAADGFTLCP